MCKKKRTGRRVRNDIETFLWAYADAIKSGLSRAEFADSIGVKTDTIYQRVYELRCRGHNIPQLSTKKPLSFDERIKKTLSEIRKVVRF